MSTEFDEVNDAEIAEGGLAQGSSSDYDRIWDTLRIAMAEETTVTGMVTDAVKGGVVVDLGIRGFVPRSQLANRETGSLDHYIGETLEAKVVEIDQDNGRVILSERKVAEEKRRAQRAETLRTLERGQIVTGVVRRIADFGAFVDIGGIDGLLHVSDMDWERVEDPHAIVKVGQEIEVRVLKIEDNGKRISLGIKQLADDPWVAARKEYREGSVIEVTIDSVDANGAVAKLGKGITGFIPVKEFGDRRADPAQTAVQAGQTVAVSILEVSPRDRKVLMSIRQAVRDRERAETRAYMQKQKDEYATPTIGDLFGDLFSKLKTRDK